MIILIVFITLICLVEFRYIEINVILKQHIELKLIIEALKVLSKIDLKFVAV